MTLPKAIEFNMLLKNVIMESTRTMKEKTVYFKKLYERETKMAA